MILKIIAALLLMGLLACALAAQEAPPAQGESPPAAPQDRSQKEPGKRHHGFGMRDGRRGPGRHAGDWLRKYQNLPPEQQEQALANDPEFQKLPPERQGRLRETLRRFNSKSPEERQRMLERMETFERFTPEQQERARALFRKWNVEFTRQVFGCERAGAVFQCVEGALKDDLTAVLTGAGSQVEDVVRGAHDLCIVFHHEDRVPVVAQF